MTSVGPDVIDDRRTTNVCDGVRGFGDHLPNLA
jgi:hypothetical protein